MNRLDIVKPLYSMLANCELGDAIRIHRNETFVDYVIKNDECDMECFILENVADDMKMYTKEALIGMYQSMVDTNTKLTFDEFDNQWRAAKVHYDDNNVYLDLERVE